jgi:hypothetical protein
MCDYEVLGSLGQNLARDDESTSVLLRQIIIAIHSTMMRISLDFFHVVSDVSQLYLWSPYQGRRRPF